MFEIARELNYSLAELSQRKDEVGLIAHTAFSLVPEKVEKEIRKAFPKKEDNPCLVRQKPKVRRAKKKAIPKPRPTIAVPDQKTYESEAEEIFDASAESGYVLNEGAQQDQAEESLTPSAIEVVENVEQASQETPEVSDEVQETVTEDQPSQDSEGDQPEAQAKAEPKQKQGGGQAQQEGAAAQRAPGAPGVVQQDLGRITSKGDSAEDSFVVGRIVSEGPKPKATPATSKKKKKRSKAEKLDSRTEWSSKYGGILAQPLPKKTQHETRGSKLQRMQLVYGHELPKKQRERDGERIGVSKDLTPTITVPANIRDLSESMGIKSTDVIKFLMTQGHFMTITDMIEQEMAELIAVNFKVEAKVVTAKQVNDVIKEIIKNEGQDENLQPRPPVITIMGHVDHGKTSLLDKIRESNLAESESGGITQHIGGYQVEKNGQLLSFLDTPGHAAFTSMRARGAEVTDIIILVVAADDGMMPQTEEAVNHAKSAGVPIIVAINKMDLEGANPSRIKEQLAAVELIPEEWSGSTPYVPVSAKTGEGIDDLLEMINLQTEMLELTADPDALGEGIVVEAQMETGRGVVASILVQKGKMKKGDPILCGRGHGWLRTMEDENKKQVKVAGPSKIVKIMGLSECPVPGDQINVMPNIKKAKSLAEERAAVHRNEQLKAKETLTMENLMTQLGSKEINELKVVIKADVQGSVEALSQSLEELGNDEVKVNVVHKGIGAVSESDILLAKAAESIVVAFRVSSDAKSRRMADKEGVEIRKYSIIYELLDELRDTLEGMLAPDSVETEVGEIEVRQVFRISNVGNIAGCYVKSGFAERNMPVRLVRDGVVVYTGKVQALRRFKEDVKRVEQRYECGVRLENCEDIRENDVIETYSVEVIQKTFD
ncbi:MAG: translation initiation factor IF-2 [Planctomycetes bacterium]|nr:translation initiation factor IF-2 [Planctomycetota bacterium]